MFLKLCERLFVLVFRHAGVWTAEEVTKMCRDKLLRLRSLYMSQFERLKHVYKNKRRKYLLATNATEEGVAGNILIFEKILKLVLQNTENTPHPAHFC